jgi:hypothetical protein
MMKNVLYTKNPASGPLQGSAGRVFFECYVTNPPRGCPVGAAEFIVPDESVTIPVSYLNNPIFRGKAHVSQTHANTMDNRGSFIQFL